MHVDSETRDALRIVEPIITGLGRAGVFSEKANALAVQDLRRIADLESEPALKQVLRQIADYLENPDATPDRE